MEATSELLQKLQRRRERMGERSPLKDISSNSAVDSRSKDFEAGRVQQRRSVFEGIENQADLSNAKPGKLDLSKWEQKIYEDLKLSQQVDLHETNESPTPSEACNDVPIDSPFYPTPSVACNDVSIDSNGESPSKCGNDIKTDAHDKFNLVTGVQICPFPTSSCRVPRVEATKLASSTAQPPPLFQGVQLCPFPSSQCRVLTLETLATMPEQTNTATNGFPTAGSSHCIDANSPPESAISMITRQSSNVALACSVEDPSRSIDDSALDSQVLATWFGYKGALPGRRLGPRNDNQNFSTQILKPLQDWAATLQQSDSCVFNHLAEGDSATPSPLKNSMDSVVAARLDTDGGSEEVKDRNVHGDSPAWEDGPEPLEYFLLDYHGVLPEELLDKIKKNVEMHSTCMQKLKRENDRLRRLARHHVEVNDQVDAEDASATCVTARSLIAAEQPNTSTASALRPCRTLPVCGGRMQSEIARTEARVAELEEAIRREGQKLREKDSERKAVAREVEAIRCEARAHRAKLNKPIGTSLERLVPIELYEKARRTFVETL